MGTPVRAWLSRVTGWLADRRLPVALRGPVYGTYARRYGVDLDEVRLAPRDHPSLSAFFVRRLKPQARPFPADPGLLPSPADGTLQSLDRVREGSILQAKGRAYPLAELLAGADEGLDLEGGWAWTIYLSPRDYHRVHAPEDCRLERVAWVPGSRYSVRPGLLARRPRVLCTNERAVLRLATERGPLLLVMVGALNVGRIRVVGVEPGGQPVAAARDFRRGEELARFEMGSTVVLVAPPDGPRPTGGIAVGDAVRMGAVLGERGEPG